MNFCYFDLKMYTNGISPEIKQKRLHYCLEISATNDIIHNWNSPV